MSNKLKGKDVITTHYFSDEEIMSILELANEMKCNRFSNNWSKILKCRTFLMFFFNPSVRTRISFEAAMTELGGHAQYLTPEMGRFRSLASAGESIEDAAQVMSKFVVGIGVRIEDKGAHYGAAHNVLKEYTKWASVPVINMADDRFHPCQGLADIMGWAEWYGGGAGKPNYSNLRGKNFYLTWASGDLHRSKTSPQEALLMASRFGMNITIAHPPGYDLDSEILGWVEKNCQQQNSQFNILHETDLGYKGAHIVYSRHWISNEAYQGGEIQKKNEIEKARKYSDWITTTERMMHTDNAIFTHPMPVDRGREVVDDVASGPRSAIYDIAENRLHVQKAIMALTMGEL